MRRFTISLTERGAGQPARAVVIAEHIGREPTVHAAESDVSTECALLIALHDARRGGHRALYQTVQEIEKTEA